MMSTPAPSISMLAERATDFGPAAALRAALRRFDHQTEHVLARYELTQVRYELLLFIQAANDACQPATVTSLRTPLQTGQTSVTQLVNATITAGLIKKTPSPHDRRSSDLALTALGAQRLRAAHTELGEERATLAQAIEIHFPTATA